MRKLKAYRRGPGSRLEPQQDIRNVVIGHEADLRKAWGKIGALLDRFDLLEGRVDVVERTSDNRATVRMPEDTARLAMAMSSGERAELESLRGRVFELAGELVVARQRQVVRFTAAIVGSSAVTLILLAVYRLSF